MALAPSIIINLPGYPFENFPSVATIAALRALPSSDFETGDNYVVDGSATAADGGGGVYSWNDGSLAVDDGLTVIKPNDTTSGQAGRWILTGNSQFADRPTSAQLAAPTGAGLLGFSYSQTYAAGTVGKALQTQFYFSAWPGADPTGVANNGAEFQAFLDFCKAAKAVARIGRGTFKINTQIVITNWVGFSIVGEGLVNSVLNFTGSGDAFSVTSPSRGTISDIAWQGSGKTSGNGLVVTGSGVGVINLLRNQFASFPGRGTYLNGTLADGMSSLDVKDNLWLSNGLIDGTPQFEARYVQDTEWEGNQWGAVALGGPYPSIGALFYSCQAGNFTSNYHWENLVGAQYEFCAYTRFTANRWETNQREGAIFKNTAFCSFVGNHLHTNGQQTTNTYDSMVMQTCGSWAMSGNQFYNFVGVVKVVRYCLNIDVNCTDIAIGETTFSDYGTSPVFNAAGASPVSFANCRPVGLGIADTSFSILRMNAGSLSGGQTSYSGPQLKGTNGNLEADSIFLMGYPGVHRQLRVSLSTSPGTGNTVTVTVRKNGVDTALTTTITGPSLSSVVEIPVTFTAADQFSVRTTAGAGAAAGFTYITLQSDR